METDGLLISPPMMLETLFLGVESQRRYRFSEPCSEKINQGG